MPDHYQCGNRIETLEKEIEKLRAALEVIRKGSFNGDWELEAKQMSVIAAEALRTHSIPSGRPPDATDVSMRNAMLRALRGEDNDGSAR